MLPGLRLHLWEPDFDNAVLLHNPRREHRRDTRRAIAVRLQILRLMTVDAARPTT